MTKTQIENALHDIGWSKKRLAQEVGLMESAISNCIADSMSSTSCASRFLLHPMSWSAFSICVFVIFPLLLPQTP